MTLSLADYLVAGFITLAGGWLGAFLGAYLKQKGENLATKEDLRIVVEQVRATTEVTESIRTTLTGKQWLSQERWKRMVDLYIDTLKMLDTMANDSVYVAKALREGRVDKGKVIGKATENLQGIMVMAQIVSPTLLAALKDVGLTAKTEGESQQEHLDRLAILYRKMYHDVAKVARQELGFENATS